MEPLLNKKTLLLVDDNPTNLALLFDYLGAAGYRVLTAESGESALRRVEYVRPDLVILDVMMPGLDGFEACRQLKRIPGLKDVPVIFMSALNDTTSKVTGFEVGGVDFITKPIRQEEVLARIRTHLHLSELQESLRDQIAARDEAIRELDAFSHTIAHDLKNPLGGILGIAETLLTMGEDMAVEERNECLELIQDSGRRMHIIIEGLMILNSVRKEVVLPRAIPMNSLFEQAYLRFIPAVQQSGARLKVGKMETAPKVLGYETWLEEVWVNCIHTALELGAPPVEIEVGWERSPGAIVRFSVDFRGGELSPEVHRKLFTPFTGLSQVRGSDRGLGMAVVHRILEKLDGRMGLERVDGGINRLYYELPEAR